MTSIEQLQLCGIRSFDPNPARRQTVTFHKPLTVILGKNGAGKTTIIEALLNACTGAMPPGSGTEKSAFVYDPKVLGESEVKAQIRLIFTGKGGKVMQVIRSFQTSRSRNKLTFTTLDNTIAFQDTQTHKVVSNTYRASDVDRVIPEMLGVSSAVLEHVIFCHQEDCNWPLAPPKDVKRIFDDIFAATRYVLALERLRENSKELKRQQKEHETTLMALREHREQAAQLEDEIAHKQAAIEQVRKQNESIEPELRELYSSSTQIDSAEREMEGLMKEAMLLEGRIEEKRQAITRTQHVRSSSLPNLTNENIEDDKSNNNNNNKKNDDNIENYSTGTLFEHMPLADLVNREKQIKVEIAEIEAELSLASQQLNASEERTRSHEGDVHSMNVTVRLLQQEMEQHVRNQDELRHLLKGVQSYLTLPNNYIDAHKTLSEYIDYIVHDEVELTNTLAKLQQMASQRRSELTNMEQHNASAVHDAEERRQSLLRSIEGKRQERTMLESLMSDAKEKLQHIRAEHAQLGTKETLQKEIENSNEQLRTLTERMHVAERVRLQDNGEHTQRVKLLHELDEQNKRVAELRQRLASQTEMQRSRTEITILQTQISKSESNLQDELVNHVWPKLIELSLVDSTSAESVNVNSANSILANAIMRCQRELAECQAEQSSLYRNRALVEQRQTSHMQEKMSKELEMRSWSEDCRRVLMPLLASHANDVYLATEQTIEPETLETNQTVVKVEVEPKSKHPSSITNSDTGGINTSPSSLSSSSAQRAQKPHQTSDKDEENNDLTNPERILTAYHKILQSTRHRVTELSAKCNNAQARQMCYHEFVRAAETHNLCMVCNRPFNTEEEQHHFITINSQIANSNMNHNSNINNETSGSKEKCNEFVHETLHNDLHEVKLQLASLESLQDSMTRLQQHCNVLPQLSASITELANELATIAEQTRTVCQKCNTIQEQLHTLQTISQKVCTLTGMSQEIVSMRNQLSACMRRVHTSHEANNNNNSKNYNTESCNNINSTNIQSEHHHKRIRDEANNNSEPEFSQEHTNINDASNKESDDEGETYEALNANYNEATTRLHSLNVQLSELEKLHAGSAEDITVVQREMHKMQSTVQQLEFKLHKLNDCIAREELEAESVQTLESRLQKVEIEIKKLESEELSHASSVLTKLRQEVQLQEETVRNALRVLESALHQIESAAPRVLSFLNSNRTAELHAAERELEQARESLVQIKRDVSQLMQRVVELRSRLKSHEQTLQVLRVQLERVELQEALAADTTRLTEVQNMMNEMKAKQIPNLQHLVGDAAQTSSFVQLRDMIRSKINELERTKAQRDGNMEAMLQDMGHLKSQLAKDKYQNIEKRYRSVFLKVETTEIAVKDIDKYYVALEKAVQSYHQEKISQINQIIAELWRQTYRGSDIDTVEICSETEANTSTSARRSYNYRVIMRRGSSVIDMRGRCSAGQRVLACVIIRLALSEAFCCDCGILALDEPTTNLDEDNARSLAEALRALIETRRSIKHFQLVIITHDEQFVRALGGQTLDRFYYVHKDREGAFSVIDERTFDQLFA